MHEDDERPGAGDRPPTAAQLQATARSRCRRSSALSAARRPAAARRGQRTAAASGSVPANTQQAQQSQLNVIGRGGLTYGEEAQRHPGCPHRGRTYLGLQRAKNPDGRMPLMDHLRELRNRVVKVALAVLAGAIVGWVFYDQHLGLHEAAVLPCGAAGQVPGRRAWPLPGVLRRARPLLLQGEDRDLRRRHPHQPDLAVPALGFHRSRPVLQREAAGRTCSSARRYRCSAWAASSLTSRWAAAWSS